MLKYNSSPLSRSFARTIGFALRLTLWAFASILALFYSIILISKLSLSFFYANGMIKDPEIAEAFLLRVLSVDPLFFTLILAGLIAILIINGIFAHSQFKYLRNIQRNLAFLLQNSSPQNIPYSCGPYQKFVQNIYGAILSRLQPPISTHATAGDPEKSSNFEDFLLNKWPSRPKMSWVDQFQFMAVSLCTAIFFCFLASIFFWQVHSQMVTLSQQLIRFTAATGPQFFSTQEEILNILISTIFGLLMVVFATYGYRYGSSMAGEGFGILRELRHFALGNLSARVRLRNEDTALELAQEINHVLAQLEDKIKANGK